MTNHSDQPNAADARRAAALTIHHRNGNPEGVFEIVRETVETTRAAELVMAILDLHRIAIIELKTPAGIDLMGFYVQGLAAYRKPESGDLIADALRAARLLDAYGRTDIDGINEAILDAVKADRPTQLVIGLLELYDHLIPELTSTAGLGWLNRCIASFAAEENNR